MAPITADGRLWGTLDVFSASTEHFPPDAQQRLADFTNLVALALESAEAHDQLTASRARILEASSLSAAGLNGTSTTAHSSAS
jgi:GAF domain-containing protein